MEDRDKIDRVEGEGRGIDSREKINRVEGEGRDGG